ncbi:hypothetical protein Q8A67_025829 [Cirrhinus molitorella]|uniref:Uncharacterized protein n=1 Tax=Cirrhinus molitorella TaxID=172907 RepID=A0AA88P0W9_9TELE|nr:hypothetical protein Q8A67_025829 [Cirrhinus molitorella]
MSERSGVFICRCLVCEEGTAGVSGSTGGSRRCPVQQNIADVALRQVTSRARFGRRVAQTEGHSFSQTHFTRLSKTQAPAAREDLKPARGAGEILWARRTSSLVSGRIHLDPQPTPPPRQAPRNARNLPDLPFGSTDLRLTHSRAIRAGDSGVKLLRFGTEANCSQKASENISDLHEERLGVSGKRKLACVPATIAEKSEGWLRRGGEDTEKEDRESGARRAPVCRRGSHTPPRRPGGLLLFQRPSRAAGEPIQSPAQACREEELEFETRRDSGTGQTRSPSLSLSLRSKKKEARGKRCLWTLTSSQMCAQLKFEMDKPRCSSAQELANRDHYERPLYGKSSKKKRSFGVCQTSSSHMRELANRDHHERPLYRKSSKKKRSFGVCQTSSSHMRMRHGTIRGEFETLLSMKEKETHASDVGRRPVLQSPWPAVLFLPSTQRYVTGFSPWAGRAVWSLSRGEDLTFTALLKSAPSPPAYLPPWAISVQAQNLCLEDFTT